MSILGYCPSWLRQVWEEVDGGKPCPKCGGHLYPQPGSNGQNYRCNGCHTVWAAWDLYKAFGEQECIAHPQEVERQHLEWQWGRNRAGLFGLLRLLYRPGTGLVWQERKGLVPKVLCWVVAPTYKLTETIWGELKAFIPSSLVVGTSEVDHCLRLVGGVEVWMKTAAEPERLVGVEDPPGAAPGASRKRHKGAIRRGKLTWRQ